MASGGVPEIVAFTRPAVSSERQWAATSACAYGLGAVVASSASNFARCRAPPGITEGRWCVAGPAICSLIQRS